MSVVTNLFHRYDDFSLSIRHWEIADQGITALWGPSGSGKTTIFRILIGLEPCPTLKWHYNGIDLAELSVAKRRLGVVFQSLELFGHLSARDNIMFAARARKLPGPIAELRFLELTSDLHLNHCLDRRADILSGGEKQRVALARALIGQPRFLLLDEPFSSLDSQLRSEARKLVRSVMTKQKIAALLVTHDDADLHDLADSVHKISDLNRTTDLA